MRPKLWSAIMKADRFFFPALIFIIFMCDVSVFFFLCVCQFVQVQREKKSRLEEVQSWHEVKLLKHSYVAWKVHILYQLKPHDFICLGS